MRTFSTSQTRSVRSRRAFTIVELLVSSFIAVLVMGSLGMLVLQMGREQREAMSDGGLQDRAGLVADRLVGLLRSMSVSESVLFTEPVAGSTNQFCRIIIARGEAPDNPREDVYFNTNALTLTYDPNRSVAGDEITLCKPDTVVTLRKLYFSPTMKTDDSTDGSTMNVTMEFDDGGYSARKNSSGYVTTTGIQRCFTVKLRNN